GDEHFRNAFQVNQRLRCIHFDWSLFSFSFYSPDVQWLLAYYVSETILVRTQTQIYSQLSRTREFESYRDISERITLSPTCRPSVTSMKLTEARPSFTLVREAPFA